MADRRTNNAARNVTRTEKGHTEMHDLKSKSAGYLKNEEEDSKEVSVRKPYVFLGNEDSAGDVNMEAAITSGDAVQAGGFGATDDIGSFPPVATDTTDFEPSLHDGVHRPGLG